MINFINDVINNTIAKTSSNNILSEKFKVPLNLFSKLQNLIRSYYDYSFDFENFSLKKQSMTRYNNKIILKINYIHSFKLNIAKNILSKEEKQIIILMSINNSTPKIDLIIDNELFPHLFNLLNNDIIPNIDLVQDNIRKYFNTLLIFINNKLSLNELLPSSTNRNKLYNSHLACQYAQKYALNYNNNYKNFNDSGGDCTNFISQCIHTGGLNETYNWKPYNKNWITVNGLYSHLIKHHATDIYNKELYSPGDIVQFYSNSKGYFSHSGIITYSIPRNNYLYCCHTYDKLNFPLSEIYPIFYDKLRVLKIYS